MRGEVRLFRYKCAGQALRPGAGLRSGGFLARSIRLFVVGDHFGRNLVCLLQTKRSGDLSKEEFSAVSSRIQNDRIRWELIEVGVSVLDRAEEIIQGAVPMRAVDAIHVASLMSFQAASSVQVPFVTGDARQREAANQFGLDVIWVG
jgi:hypothetical protein